MWEWRKGKERKKEGRKEEGGAKKVRGDLLIGEERKPGLRKWKEGGTNPIQPGLGKFPFLRKLSPPSTEEKEAEPRLG